MIAKITIAANTEVPQLVKATRMASLKKYKIKDEIRNLFKLPQTIIVDRVVGTVSYQTAEG